MQRLKALLPLLALALTALADPRPASAAPGGFTAQGADTCLSCHNDESMLLIFRTPHGQGADPESPFAHLQCEACHGPGGEHVRRDKVGAGHPPIASFGPEATSPIEEQNEKCMSCHTRHVGLAWQGSVHERNLVGCGDCHRVHDRVDPVSMLTEQAEVCFRCHQRQRADSLKPYVHPVRYGLMTCTACHRPHHADGEKLLSRDTINELCWSCHSELRGPFLFEHAPVSEDCSLCHRAHGSIHPAMLDRRPPLLCQGCHSQRGHPSNVLTTSGLPGGSGPPSAFLLGGSCLNCHSQVHGSNHPSGINLLR